MGSGYSIDGSAAAANASIGTIVNTGGTATVGGVLGDVANSSIATRLTAIKTETDQIGTITNTSGTATIGAVLGDFATGTIVDRMLVHKQFTTTLDVSNTTGSKTIATLSANGGVWIYGIIGTVTTVLSSNITAAHLRLNDSTNTPAITLATGTTLSSAAVGSRFTKNALAATALIFNDSAQCRVIEHATSGMHPNNPFQIIAKTATTTTMEFRYTTTNTPSTGVIVWDIWYRPINGGSLS